MIFSCMDIMCFNHIDSLTLFYSSSLPAHPFLFPNIHTQLYFNAAHVLDYALCDLDCALYVLDIDVYVFDYA